MVINEDGMNTYGYWIVKCEKCGEIFKVYIGRDVRDSSLIYGGAILGIYDDDVYGDKDVKNQVLKFKEDETQKLVFHRLHLRTNRLPLKGDRHFKLKRD
jgi:hypothetical protein